MRLVTKKQVSDTEGFLKMMNSHGSALVTLENKVDNCLPPLDFNCITAPIYGANVPLPDPSFLAGCEGCEPICTSASCSCSAQSNKGNLVYSPEGLLLIDSGPIYECNVKCSCPPSCPNRVIQRGRQVPLVITRFANGKGWGVRAAEPIRKGTFIELYLGEVITSEEANRRFLANSEGGHANYLFDLDFFFEPGIESVYTIDANQNGNISHFFNHSCDPNLCVHPCFIDTWDPYLHQIAFFAQRDIKAGEELCFDYLGGVVSVVSRGREAYRRIDNKGSMPCFCMARNCRGFVF